MSADAIFDTAAFREFDEYKQIFDFASKHERLTLPEFQKAVVKDINLFAIPQDYNFEKLNASLNEIVKALPHIKNILSRPITHIKNENEILPVEAVRSISNETVSHISVHSELWQNIENGNLRPRKLLSQNHIDNYAIYENVIVTRFIDYLLLFVNRNITFLNNVLYSNRDLNFNLLERENHLSYFLALGELHTGYVRDYSKYSVLCEACLEKLKFVNRVLKAGLSKPVYKRCKKTTAKLSLRKTNIFKNDKDYGRVYKLIKYFAAKAEEQETASVGGRSISAEGYFDYCTLITLFGISRFNFNFAEDTVFNFKKLNANASFKDFKLKVQTLSNAGIDAIKISVTRDREYSIVLVLENARQPVAELLSQAKEAFSADEYKLLSAFDSNSSTVLLSSFDIESFRKVQQLVFKAMVYADGTYDVCPFCGEELERNGEKHFCKLCRTEITDNVCPETERSYKAVSISNLKINKSSLRSDALMHFRNITEISNSADIICPHCGKIHC